ncbi:hypothetical protein [Actinoplanes sp. NBRC 103695]|uniref:hypothetical protein n=1 Tax=Actinoplanes sp. NBRC 103695 TaxID=3032202 RepID=UPI0024A03A48|nr:hypothetical protein [Actinoplanes sp. NBRC 103695]GLY98812.1 hypothetical protein Acsp02_60660 [Actinoplanes sp. NBRC 103695]
MGDHDRTDETLILLARHGAYEVLSAMHHYGGSASFAQISAESPRPTALLRAMAAEGFLISPSGGTLDADPHDETCFRLTAKGEAIFCHLRRLREWIASRATSATRPIDPLST